MKTLFILIALATTATAGDDVTFGYTGTTADDMLAGFRMEWPATPGLVASVRDGDGSWSIMGGPSLQVGDQLALYGMIGGTDRGRDLPAVGAVELGASYRIGFLRAHCGYAFQPEGGIAFGLGVAVR